MPSSLLMRNTYMVCCVMQQTCEATLADDKPNGRPARASHAPVYREQVEGREEATEKEAAGRRGRSAERITDAGGDSNSKRRRFK